MKSNKYSKCKYCGKKGLYDTKELGIMYTFKCKYCGRRQDKNENRIKK
jgi:hypothetical protein